ncbi:hypothetical protein [Azonexus sp. IMCC34839]|uniref:hypothetical protein n=1 Tax=Azonexus sp. IMCC34839 TaxID=3133695 RepID=UPI00399A177C
MSNAAPNPKRASAICAMLSVLSTKHHIALAIPHNLATELQSGQIAEAYKAGAFPQPTWQQETEALARADLVKLRRTLLTTLMVAIALLAFALAIAASAGKVHPALEPDYGKVITWIGGGFAAWAGLLQLSPVRPTFRGSMLHEVAYGTTVRVLALLGILLAGVGALWWQ